MKIKEIIQKCPVGANWVEIPIPGGRRRMTVRAWLIYQLSMTDERVQNHAILVDRMDYQEWSVERILNEIHGWIIFNDELPRTRGKSVFADFYPPQPRCSGKRDPAVPESINQEYARMLKTNARYTISTRPPLIDRIENCGWIFALAILAGAALAWWLV